MSDQATTVLSEEQRARMEALTAARSTLTNTTLFASSGPFRDDLLVLANYIIRGETVTITATTSHVVDAVVTDEGDNQ